MNINQNLAYQLTERGILPDAMLRQGIRFLLKMHLHEINALDCETMGQQEQSFIRMWEYYLNYCEGGFIERDIGTVQMLLTKPGCRR